MGKKITEEKISRYKRLTAKALTEVKKNIISGKENYAKEIIDMVTNYLSDAQHFEDKDDYVNAFAAINYAHGWIDAGVRLDIFDVTNRDLFTIK